MWDSQLDRIPKVNQSSGQPMPEQARCTLCSELMPPGEEMFKYHGYSGPCPKDVKSPTERPGYPKEPPCPPDRKLHRDRLLTRYLVTAMSEAEMLLCIADALTAHPHNALIIVEPMTHDELALTALAMKLRRARPVTRFRAIVEGWELIDIVRELH